MPTTWNAIYLGNVGTTMDPFEGNNTAENAGDSAFVGQTFGGPSGPLYDNIVSVEALDLFGPPDRFGNAALNQNNANGSDQIRTDLDGDGTPETYVFDGVAAYNATITFLDGTTTTLAVAIFQTTTGETFLGPSLSEPANTVLSSQAILSVRLDSVISGTYQGLAVDRPVIDFICFARGTMIRTPHGDMAVETLAEGDQVVTVDHGVQPIRWIGSVEVDLAGAPHLRPVRIRAGALGAGLPEADLVVSPQHRVLVRSKIARRMFGTDEVLVAAKQLLSLDGIALADDFDSISYFHFLFDRHQLVWSNGAHTESLFTGPEALRVVGPAARDEILTLFPELARIGEARPARQIVPGRKARRMAQRHAENRQAIVC